MKTGKVWGSTEVVIATPLFEAHRLVIHPKRQCSLHAHRQKWNAFLVLKGKLFIEVKKNDYKLTDVTEIGPGQLTTVAPGEYHLFRTGNEPCEAYEFYYLSPLSTDIMRKNVGGRVK